VTPPTLAEPHALTRLKTLDAFRGLAILAVILFHYTYRWGPLWPDHRDFYGFDSNLAWFAQGRRGVEFFFLISGFVIFMTLERCRGWRDFALRRFVRLYPTYIASMVLTFIAIGWFGLADFQRGSKEFFVGLTMMSDQFGIGWIDTVYWSLMIEVVFYAWVALIYFSFRRHFVILWIGFCTLAALAYLWNADRAWHIFAAPYLCFFTLGMAFYGIHAKRGLRFTAPLIAAALIFYIAFWTKNSLAGHLTIAAAVLLFVLFLRGWLHWLGGGPLGFIGLISYPLYLLHQHIGVSLIAHMNMVPWLNGWPAVAITALIAVALASAVHYGIELPVQNVSKRFGGRTHHL